MLNESENFIINWFGHRLSDFEIPIEQLGSVIFNKLRNFKVLIDEDATFW